MRDPWAFLSSVVPTAEDDEELDAWLAGLAEPLPGVQPRPVAARCWARAERLYRRPAPRRLAPRIGRAADVVDEIGVPEPDAERHYRAYLRRDVAMLRAEARRLERWGGEWFPSRVRLAALCLLASLLWEMGPDEVPELVDADAVDDEHLEVRVEHGREPPPDADPSVDASTLIAAPGAPQRLPASCGRAAQ